MEALPLSYRKSKNECNLKELCLTFAWLHLMGNFTGCIYHIVCAFMLDPKENFEDKTVPVYLVIAVCFAFVFYRNLHFVDGLRENIARSIAAFIITIQCLVLLLSLKLYFNYTLSRRSKELSIFAYLDMAYITFLVISLMPFYILYNKMRSEFYIPQTVEFSCFKSKVNRGNAVITTEV